MGFLNWKKAKGFVKRKSNGSCWSRFQEVGLNRVILVFRKHRYHGWEVIKALSRDVERDVLWQLPPRAKRMRRRSSQVSAEGESAAIHLAAVETQLLGNYPGLVAHLAVTRYDDGASRTPGTLLLKTVGSSWVLVIKEPDDCLQMQVMGQMLDDTFALAELLITGEKAPWEPDNWAKARQVKGKK